jgi:hypothetical protein
VLKKKKQSPLRVHQGQTVRESGIRSLQAPLLVWQTGRHISGRIPAHVGGAGTERQPSTVVEHSAEAKHNINFHRIEAIANIRTYLRHVIREAIEITKRPHDFDR